MQKAHCQNKSQEEILKKCVPAETLYVKKKLSTHKTHKVADTLFLYKWKITQVRPVTDIGSWPIVNESSRNKKKTG